jgi:hypothetical protein
MPVILATQEAEIRRIAVRSQLRQIFLRPYLENIHHKKKGWQSGSRRGLEFKLWYHTHTHTQKM